MLEHRKNQLRVALHIDVVFDLILLAIILFVRNLDFFAYLVVIICPIYAYGAFKYNSYINRWVSAKLDYIDTAFLKLIPACANRSRLGVLAFTSPV